MSTEGQRLNRKAVRSRFALSIRARLMILAVIAIVPLLLDRVRDIESDRAERIEAAAKQALNLARQGMAAQNEVIVSVRAFMQVAASAHGLMTTRGERCDNFLADAVRQVSWLRNMSFVAPTGQIICSSNVDAIGIFDSHDVILDHLSLQYATDELLDIGTLRGSVFAVEDSRKGK